MLTNAAEILTERSRICPDLEATVNLATGERFTFEQLNQRVNQMAHGLVAHGIMPGQRVGILMSNSHIYVETYFALAKIGAITVTLNWRLTPNELAYQLADCSASAILYSDDQSALVQPLQVQFPSAQFLRCDSVDMAERLRSQPMTEPTLGAHGDDPLYIMYTSGTTGKPKGAVHSHSGCLQWCTLMLATSTARLGDRGLCVSPMFHIAGLGVVISNVYRGVTSVIAKTFNAGDVWKTIETEKINTALFVPAMLNFLLQDPARLTCNYASMRFIMSGAAPVPLTLIEQFSDMGIEIHQVYGATETQGGIALLMPQDSRRKIGSTGRGYFGMEVRVVDVHGCDVAPGVPGEVITRGPQVLQQYWGNPQATRDAFKDGWFYLGDIAEVDAEGFIYIKDRSKDMVISGGENIYPAEIEDVLLSHPGVSEVAVIGQPSAKWGESPVAIINRADGVLDHDGQLVAALNLLCADRLAKFKRPKAFIFTGALPRNPSGKILKRELRDQFPGPAPE